MRFKIGILILAVFCLCSCGFQPLYRQPDELLLKSAAVLIDPISGEGGYQMNLILKEKLNPKGKQVSKDYRLTVTLQKPQYSDQSIRNDNFASLKRMDIQVTYQLRNLSDDQVLISSSINSNGIFNLIDSPYATTVGEDKLYENLIQTMADDIAMHVLSYLKGETP